MLKSALIGTDQVPGKAAASDTTMTLDALGKLLGFVWLVALVGLVIGLPVYGVWYLFFRRKEKPKYQPFGDAHFATTEEVRRAGLFEGPRAYPEFFHRDHTGIRLGYFLDADDYLSLRRRLKRFSRKFFKRRPKLEIAHTRLESLKVLRYYGDAHLITVAPTRSGKGSDVLIPALLEYGGSCIVIDPKGQLTAVTRLQRARLGQRVITLNPLGDALPMDLGRSDRYNPMAFLDRRSATFELDCDNLADAIVVPEKGENSFFTDSARQLISGIIRYLAAYGREESRTLAKVQEIVSAPPSVLQAFVQTALEKDRQLVAGTLGRFENINDGNENKTLREIISTAITQCGFIDNKAIRESLSGNDFRFRDIKNRPTTVFVVLPADYVKSCAKWFRLIVAAALSEIQQGEKGSTRVLAILDEFAQLGHLNVVENAMGISAGFGIQLWPILQDLPQLKTLYKDRWESFLAGADVHQYFAPREDTTAEYISKMAGVRTVQTESGSTSTSTSSSSGPGMGSSGSSSSTSWSQTQQPLIRPHEVRQIDQHVKSMLIFGKSGIVLKGVRVPYYENVIIGNYGWFEFQSDAWVKGGWDLIAKEVSSDELKALKNYTSGDPVVKAVLQRLVRSGGWVNMNFVATPSYSSDPYHHKSARLTGQIDLVDGRSEYDPSDWYREPRYTALPGDNTDNIRHRPSRRTFMVHPNLDSPLRSFTVCLSEAKEPTEEIEALGRQAISFSLDTINERSAPIMTELITLDPASGFPAIDPGWTIDDIYQYSRSVYNQALGLFFNIEFEHRALAFRLKGTPAGETEFFKTFRDTNLPTPPFDPFKHMTARLTNHRAATVDIDAIKAAGRQAIAFTLDHYGILPTQNTATRSARM